MKTEKDMPGTKIELFQLSYQKKKEFLKVLAFLVPFFTIFAISFLAHGSIGINIKSPIAIIAIIIFLFIIKSAHGILTYKYFVAIDNTNTVHIPYDRLTYSKWKLPANSVKTNYGVRIDDSHYSTTKVRFCFEIANIVRIDRFYSFKEEEVLSTDPNIDMTQDVIAQFSRFFASKGFANKGGGVRIELKRLEPITYGQRKEKEIPVENLWDKSCFNNLAIYLSLKDPDLFLAEVRNKIDKR